MTRAELKSLDEIGTFYNGLTGKSKADFTDGNARFVTYMNVFDNIATDAAPSTAVHVATNERQNRVRYGDVLFTASSESVDEVGMSSAVTVEPPEPLYLNSFCFGFRPSAEARLDPEFTKHLFRSTGVRQQIVRTANGVTRINISKERFRKVRIPVPPLKVQREIVSVLDAFTELEAELQAELEGRRRQYAHYRDLFFSPARHKAPGVQLRNLAGTGFFRDGDWVESKDQDPSGGVRLTQLADVGVDVFRDRSDRWMREDQAVQLGCTFLEPGDVLIARMPDPLGRACQVPERIGRAVTAVDVAILRSKCPDVIPRYVMYAINSHWVRRQIASFQAGGTRQRITRKNLGTVEIPIPSPEEQERVVLTLDRFDALVNDLSIGLPAELKARRQQYEHYRDRLLAFPDAA